ncbi:MAG: biotin/lipoyl-containing protein, partial [Steroidobacter sp.]
MAQEIHVPDIGDFKNVEVIDVLVKAGDKVEVDTPLITIETEKATMDVPSSAAGVIKSIAVRKGDRVSKDSLVLTLEGAAAAKAPVTEAPEPAVTSESAPAPVASEHIIAVPDIGDFKGVEVIDVLIKVGDKVEVDTPLITLETEKATMDVPSTAAGVVKSIAVKKGDRVSKDTAVAVLTVTGAATVAASGTASKPTTAPVAALAPAHVAPAPVSVTVSSPAALPAINEA